MLAERSGHQRRAGSERYGPAVAVPAARAVNSVEGGWQALTAPDRPLEPEVARRELQLPFAKTVCRPTLVTITKNIAALPPVLHTTRLQARIHPAVRPDMSRTRFRPCVGVCDDGSDRLLAVPSVALSIRYPVAGRRIAGRQTSVTTHRLAIATSRPLAMTDADSLA